MLHPILRRQLRKLRLSADAPPDPAQWTQFLERVDASYQGAELDRYTLERSLRLSSEEMRELTHRLETTLEHLRKLSMTDALTGVMNRRFLNATIQEEVAQVLRHYRELAQGGGGPRPSNLDLAFVIVDIDHFKDVNDVYGHGTGDQVLIQVCQLLSRICRETDTVIRWGGEEFLVLARRLSRSELGRLCERIRAEMAAFPFHIVGQDKPIGLTCSIGAAVFPFLGASPGALSWEEVLDVADKGLYAAKRSGRNAWVWLASTDRATSEELTSGLGRGVSALLQAGKLELHSSLSGELPAEWPI